MVRWGGQVRAPEPELRFTGTDAALARLDELIAQASAKEPPDLGLIARLRRDRVVALRDRERWADAVSQGEALRRGGDRLPVYGRLAEADSLLALRRPSEARAAFEEVMDAEPQRQGALIIDRRDVLLRTGEPDAAVQSADHRPVHRRWVAGDADDVD